MESFRAWNHYAIKTQLKARNVREDGPSVPLAVSVWHKRHGVLMISTNESTASSDLDQ